MMNSVSPHLSAQQRGGVAQVLRSARPGDLLDALEPMRRRPRAWLAAATATAMVRAVAAVAACASLAGCASAGDVAATGNGTYSVAASATGGRMAWARAHEHAINEAREYCERRGMQSSVTTETVSGVQMMSEHASLVNFECHPKF